MKKVLFFFNPHAGHSGIRTQLLPILETFCGSGCSVRVHTTSGPREITQMIAREGAGYDLIVSSGGDGTLNETIAGLIQLPDPPTLGYIPAGTVNDVAASLGLSLDALEAARDIVFGEEMPLDAGQFNGRAFTYVAAFGAFTEVSYATPQESKRVLGRLAYLLEGAARLTSIQSYRLRVEHDGGREEGDFIYGMVSNTVSGGGFKGISPDLVELDDGLFEVVLVRQPQNAAQLQSIIRSLVQTTPEPGGAVVAFRTAHLRVTCADELPWTLDGEYGGAPRVAEIQNVKQAVMIAHGK